MRRRVAATWLVALSAMAAATNGASGQDVGTPYTLRFAFQRPDLIRYNRVEALSVGVRGQLRPRTSIGPVSLTTYLRIGVADLEPNVSQAVVRETLRARVSLRLFHELAAIEEGARPFGTANSILAATVGRDDGDYYRRTGAEVVWTPATADPRWYRMRAFVERHRNAPVETDFFLLGIVDDTRSFRPNLLAESGWEVGVSATLAPYWGTDPVRAQAGLDATLQAVAGNFEHVRASLEGHTELPLPGRLRLEATAGLGTVWGSPSTQRLWYLGGPTTLRGYEPRVLGGDSFGRLRGQLGRRFSFGRLTVFSDLGWAGERDRIRSDDALYSVGGGLGIVDDLIHVDGAWGLNGPRGFRLDVYLDEGF